MSTAGSRYQVEASPSFAHLARQTAQEISHPTDIGRTLWDARTDRGALFGDNIDTQTKKLLENEDEQLEGFGVGALGSGSDFTVFLQRLGVGRIQLLFRGRWC